MIVFICATSSAEIPGNTSNVTRQKARYFWFEAAKQQAFENYAEAYELYRYSSKIDPEYLEARQNKSLLSLYTRTDIDTLILRQLKTYIDIYPGDIPESEQYAQLSMYAADYDESIRVYKNLLKRKPSRTDYLLSISNALANSNKFDEAYDTLQAYRRQEGMNPQLAEQMVLLSVLGNDTVKAKKFIDELLSEYPASADYQILKYRYYSEINADTAYNALIRAEQLEPENGTPKMLLAFLYQEQGDSIMSNTKIYDALMCDNFNLDQKIQIISEYVQPMVKDGKSLAQAEHLFYSLEKQYPREAKVMALTASFYSVQKNWNKARETTRMAIDMDPDNSAYWNQLMYYDNQAGLYEETEKDYNQALDFIETEDNDMQTTLAISYLLRKNYDMAMLQIKKLINAIDSTLTIVDLIDNPTLKNTLDYKSLIRLSAYYSLTGDIFIAQKDTTMGFISYDNSLYFNPENANTLNNYAYNLALIENGDLAKAAQMSAKSISFEPENATYYDTYAWICYKQGDYDNARILQKKALELIDPEQISTEIYEHYGDILLKCNKVQEAIENWEKALEIDSENIELKAKINQTKAHNK